MSELNIATATIGLLVVALGALSRLMQRLWVTGPMIAVAAGIVLGPAGLNLVHPAGWGDEHHILEQVARLPALLILRPLLSPQNAWRSILFLGWFGPIGVAALFYAMLMVRKAGFHQAWEVGSLVVFASVVVHGVTSTPGSKLYDRGSSGESAPTGG